MTDGQLLFAVFAALYLIECLRLLPVQAWLCSGSKEGRWKVRPLSSLIGSRGWALALLRPLPPFNAHFVALPWVFVPHPDGLLVREGTGSGRVVDWNAVEPAAGEGSLRIGGSVIVRLPSAKCATEWCDRLREWKKMDAGKREKAFLQFAAESLDPQTVQQRANTSVERTRALRSNAAWIMIWCFGVVSGVHAWYGETPRLWIALGGLLVMQLMQAGMFWAAARKEPSITHRFWKTIAIGLLPQHSIRAADHFFRAAELVPHPLAARALLDDESFLVPARKFWREARFQPGGDADGELPLEAKALQRFFKQAGVSVESLEQPPAHDGTSSAYCPRCQGQFLASVHECRDCGGIKLRAFELTSPH